MIDDQRKELHAIARQLHQQDRYLMAVAAGIESGRSADDAATEDEVRQIVEAGRAVETACNLIREATRAAG